VFPWLLVFIKIYQNQFFEQSNCDRRRLTADERRKM
jgi:hypothetical protein